MRLQGPSCLAVLSVVALMPVPAAPGEPATPSPPPRPAPCASPEHRAFDFWVGTWEVTTPDGKRAGRNTITRVLGGCVLHESWEGAGGVRGESHNIYSAADGQWHQTWVDSGGNLLLLNGGMSGGTMVMTGKSKGEGGATVEERITWQAMPDGRVRQHWEQSTDGGKSWKDAFVGIYAREAPEP